MQVNNKNWVEKIVFAEFDMFKSSFSLIESLSYLLVSTTCDSSQNKFFREYTKTTGGRRWHSQDARDAMEKDDKDDEAYDQR